MFEKITDTRESRLFASITTGAMLLSVLIATVQFL